MSSLIPERLARRLILCLFLLKMVITIYDMIQVGPGNSYDAAHHGWRARSGGLEMGKMAYNPPLYYFPALPSVDLHKFYKDGKPVIAKSPYDSSPESRKLLARARAFNGGYIFVFYVAWIWFVFPYVLPGRRAWFLASLFFLSLPGFQKVAVMAHPDNLLMAFSAVTTAIWVYTWRLQKRRVRDGFLLAFATGLTGITRPFAVVVVFFFSLVNAVAQVKEAMWGAARRSLPLWRRLLGATGRLAMIAAVVGVLAGAWWVFRYVETGEITNAYREEYIEPFQPLKKQLDLKHYYASFHFRELLEHPSRDMSGSNEPSLNPLGNTFPTIFYSEVWGDHWNYFNGGKNNSETKTWLKRVVFVVALPLSALFMVLLGVGVIRAAVRAVRARQFLTPEAMMPVIACVGWALFVYWQGHSGLLPGKNSTIKFLYVAYVVPYAVATAFTFRPRERAFHWLTGYILLVFGVSMPIAIWGA